MIFDTPANYLRAFETDPTLAILPMQTAAEFRNVSRAAIDRMLRLKQLEEISIGKTRYVRILSLVSIQRRQDERITTVRAYLEQCARKKTIVVYEPVRALIGLSHAIPADRTSIGKILDAVSKQTWEEKRILLSVIVHRKTLGKTRPGPGFFTLAKSFGFSLDDKDTFIAKETEKVWAGYALPK